MPSLSPFACPISSASPIAFAAVVEGVRFSARITLPVDDVTAGAGVPVGSSEMLYTGMCTFNIAHQASTVLDTSAALVDSHLVPFQNQPFLWLKMMMYTSLKGGP